MDFLLKNADAIQKAVFWATAQRLNLTVDLSFFNTTNTYFEMEDINDSKLLAFACIREIQTQER